uniref:Uncharacterized protein n=1 Tax=Catagonus wagneri TaxID=51154 RepID=A0A8C3WQY5_9CETA
MGTSSRGVKDLDPPLAVVHHHHPACLGTQRQPRGVDQSPPSAKGVGTHLWKTSRLLFIIQQSTLISHCSFPLAALGAVCWGCPGLKPGLRAHDAYDLTGNTQTHKGNPRG